MGVLDVIEKGVVVEWGRAGFCSVRYARCPTLSMDYRSFSFGFQEERFGIIDEHLRTLMVCCESKGQGFDREIGMNQDGVVCGTSRSSS